MKKILITFIGLLVCIESFPQLGYRYEDKFIQLTPTSEKCFLVQARSKEAKEFLQKKAKKDDLHGSNETGVNQISENTFFVSSTAHLMEDDYKSELYVDSRGNPFFILPRIILALKDNARINDVIKDFTKNLSVDSSQKLKGMITLTCNYSSAQDVLKAVSELTNNKEVEWVEPDMICRIKTACARIGDFQSPAFYNLNE